MAKLNYANLFIVSTNVASKEVVIGCYQDYQEYSFGKTPSVIKGEMQRELITEIVMTPQNAEKLQKLLAESIAKLTNAQQCQPIIQDSGIRN